MKYTLTVVKHVPNPDYVKQAAEWQERNRYRGGMFGDPQSQSDPYPSQFLEERSVYVELKEAEWDVIRQTLVAHWAIQ